MKRIGVAAITAIVLLALAGAARAEERVVLPYWSSDQIRAVRSLAPEDTLAFDLETVVSVGGGPPKTQHQAITLGSSFTLVATEGEDILYDHALCRALGWSLGKSALANDSCFSAPAFRVMEIRNREFLRSLLAKVEGKTAAFDDRPYWAEAELGVQETPSTPLVKHQVDEGAEYRLGEEIVARVSGSATSLSPDEGHRLARFLALTANIHPQIRHDLVASATLPLRIEFKIYQGGKEQREVLTVANVRRSRIAYPLPAGLTPQIDDATAPGDPVKREGLHQAILAIEGKSQIARPTARALLASMRNAADAGRAVEGMFAFIELTQQYSFLLSGDRADPSLLAELRPSAQKIFADPAARPFLAANALAGDHSAAGDRQASATYLATTSFDDVPFGTFRYVTFANLVGNSGDTSKWDAGIFDKMPRPLDQGYWRHIAAYPWSSFAFKDAGDYYLRNYDASKAWLAYDLGRAVDPQWRSGPMEAIGKFEHQLLQGEPDFF